MNKLSYKYFAFSLLFFVPQLSLSCEVESVRELDKNLLFGPYKISSEQLSFKEEMFCVGGNKRYLVQFLHVPENAFEREVRDGDYWFFKYDENGKKIELEEVILYGNVVISNSKTRKIIFEQQFDWSIRPGMLAASIGSIRTPFSFFGKTNYTVTLKIDYKASKNYLDRYGVVQFRLIDPNTAIGH